jgi:hypothetical protein
MWCLKQGLLPKEVKAEWSVATMIHHWFAAHQQII